jgi:signal transduction histidine kinase
MKNQIKKTTFLIAFALLHFTNFAQNSLIDSLLLKLKNHPTEDSLHSEILKDVAQSFKGKNNLLTIKYFEEARVLGMKENTPQFVTGRHLDLGETYSMIGNSQKALEHFLNAEKLGLKYKNERHILKTYIDISNLYLTLEDPKKAKAYLIKASQHVDVNKPSNQLCWFYNCKGDFFMQEGQYDSCVFYQKKIIAIASQMDDVEYNGVAAEMNLGLIYKKQKKYNEALAILFKVKNRKDVMEDDYYKAVLYNNIGATYSAMKQSNNATDYFKQSLLICKEKKIEFVAIENYKNLAEMYEKDNNPRMQNIYLKMFYSTNDSMNSKDNQNQLNQLERNFFEEANAKLLISQKEKSTRFTLIAFFTGLISIGLLSVYVQSRKRSILLQAQKSEIEKQNISLEKLNHTKDKLFRIIGHDLRNPLVSLSAFLNKSEQNLDNNKQTSPLKKETTIALQNTIELLDNLLTWANTQLHGNRTITKKVIDLEDLLDDICIALRPQAQLKHIKLVQTIAHDASHVISNADMLGIVLRNILTNAIKFSQAESTIVIKTYLQNQSVHIAIRDEGIGMSKTQLNDLNTHSVSSTKGTAAEHGTGLGMTIIKDFTHKLDIKWHVESTMNIGTTFILSMPT